MIRYAMASLTPAVLLGLGCIAGGVWIWLGLASMTLVVFAADRLTRLPALPRDDMRALAHGNRLCIILTAAHFLLLGLGVHALAHGTGSPAATVALWFGIGMFLGQVSNATGHELIHAPQRGLRRLGTAIFSSLLFGHHVSAHLRVHHPFVASDRDPNSARPGEGFHRFWPRAVIGSFLAGLRAENRLRQGHARGVHPYVIYALGGAATVIAALLTAGWPGLFALIALTTFAQMQLMLSDYVQHYGLRRKTLANGRLEPVSPRHSWNASPWYSAAMMLNAPRHSDHHVAPTRRFTALRLNPDEMPMLPSTFPVMAMIATVPPLWKRLMDPRVARFGADRAAGVNPVSTIGSETRDPVAEFANATTIADSDRFTRPAAGRSIRDERRGV